MESLEDINIDIELSCKTFVRRQKRVIREEKRIRRNRKNYARQANYFNNTLRGAMMYCRGCGGMFENYNDIEYSEEVFYTKCSHCEGFTRLGRSIQQDMPYFCCFLL
jgi:hypothetical protein